MSKKFSESEIQFIRDNYKNMTDFEMAKELKRTESSITTKRKRLGFTRSNRKYYWCDVIKAFSKASLILLSDESEYHDCSTKLKYICSKHNDKGIQEISLHHLLEGEGCFFCGRETATKKNTLLFDEVYYKRLCEERNYTYVGAERIDGFISVKFICNSHKDLGIQHQNIYNLKKRNSCQYCVGKNLPKWFIEKQIIVNNPNIEVLSEYDKLTDYVTCKCKKHNIVSQKKIQNVLRGQCCYKCGLENRHSSYREEEICGLLAMWGYKYERQYTFDKCIDKYRLPFDFYIPDYNTCIEYDGKHHYYPIFGEDNLEIMMKHDNIKNKYCKINNIKLIRIPYWECNNLNNYLFNKLVCEGIVKLIG